MPPYRMPCYKDIELVCRGCGASFYFTAGEQEFYADKGFLNEPTRCPRCRSRRERGGHSEKKHEQEK